MTPQENAYREIVTDAYLNMGRNGERGRIREHVDWVEDRWQKVAGLLEWVASFDPDADPTTYPHSAEFVRRAREVKRELGLG